MKLVITGLSHHTAPVEVREKLAFEEKSLPGALDRLCQRPGMVEGMILSTCNRVEVAVTAEESSDAANSALPVSLQRAGCDPAPVPRGFQSGLDDRGRAADPGPVEERVHVG
jgi:glutamyl-tRNA reductase